MASKGARKAGTHRMDGAIIAVTPLGFSKKLIRSTIRELIIAYGDNDTGWYFVEENYYKLAIVKIIEDQEGKKEEDDKKNEEIAAVAYVEAKRKEACGEAPFELEAGSSSSRDLSGMAIFSPERAPTKLEACSDMVPGIELSQISPPSVPKRRPCYGWISEEDDED